MTILRAIATIVGCAVLFAGIGVGIGYGLGEFAPGYYRGVFRGGQEPAFDPVAVGVGLGLTQGTASGVVIGIILVALFLVKSLLERNQSTSTESDVPSGPPTRLLLRVVLIGASVLVLLGCTATGVIVGVFNGSGNAYQLRFAEERELLAPVVASDPAFAGVKIEMDSLGHARLHGEVPTPLDRDRLDVRVERAIGVSRAKDTMRAVTVKR